MLTQKERILKKIECDIDMGATKVSKYKLFDFFNRFPEMNPISVETITKCLRELREEKKLVVDDSKEFYCLPGQIKLL